MDDYVFGALWVALLVFSVRSAWAADERVRVACDMLGFAYREMEQGLPWRWRVAELDQHSTMGMTLRFWRPVSSFYRNARCLQPHEELT